MEESQTNTKNTTIANTPVDFTTVDPSALKFSEEFKCAKSAAGQVVVGLRWLANTLSSSKEITNDYQKILYPTIIRLANKVCDKYMELFVSGISEPLQIQVYAANLNGRLNDGRLRHDIPCKNTDRRSRYKYSQLGQLLSLLYDRLLFISRRNVDSIQRYVDNKDERTHFESLQKLCSEFCTFLRGDDTSIMSVWTTFVNSSRQTNGVPAKPPRDHKSQSFTRGRGKFLWRGGAGGRGTTNSTTEPTLPPQQQYGRGTSPQTIGRSRGRGCGRGN
jgi:hypothetical protein